MTEDNLDENLKLAIQLLNIRRSIALQGTAGVKLGVTEKPPQTEGVKYDNDALKPQLDDLPIIQRETVVAALQNVHDFSGEGGACKYCLEMPDEVSSVSCPKR